MTEMVVELTLEMAWKALLKLVVARSEFREQRERLEIQWKRLLPLLDEKTTSEFEDQLELEMGKCGQLFTKCDKVSNWNVVKKSYYNEKLKKKGRKIEVLLQNAMSWRIELIQSRLDESLLPPLPGKVFGIEMSLGVCGLGGCGKTTLVRALCNDSGIKAEYGKPTWLSNSPQQLETICRRLVREFNEMDSTPGASTSAKKASTSKNKADVNGRRRKMLIVLDDVSSVNDDIRVLVDAMKEKAADSRILITSRVKLHICDESYSVKQLSQDDARKLFEHHTSNGDRERCWKPDRQLIDEIVRGCKLHPLALTVIGGSLAKGDERMWRGTANSLKQNGGIFSVTNCKEIIECLSTSLTSLSKKDHECFLDLASFPQSLTIPASVIIDMWTETRHLDEKGAYVILRELDRRNLVQLVDRQRGGAGYPNGSFSSLSVSQDVLLRELAISESRKEGNSQIPRLIMENEGVSIPESWRLEKGRTKQAKLVSINTAGDMKKSDWPDLDLPKAEVLILYFSASSYYLPRFLQSMKNLKVLVVANHGSNPVELDGLYLLSSLKELKRATFTNIIFPAKPLRMVKGGSWSRLRKFLKRSASIRLCVSAELAPELQKISLVHCDFHCMLRILSLFPIVRDLEMDDCIDLDELPDAIYDISSLQKLSITNSPGLLKLAKGIDKLRNLKTLRLHACAGLKHLPQSLSKLSELTFLDISDCYRLDAFPQEMEKMSSLKTIDMRSCSSIMEVPSSMVGSLEKVICDKEAVALMWTSCGLDRSKLEKR